MTLESVRENFSSLKQHLRENTSKTISIIAVTKTLPASVYHICYVLGITHIGENKAQELKSKIHLTDRGIIKSMKYHFIGRIQGNKLKEILLNASSLDTICSIKQIDQVKQISEKKRLPPVSVLLQINSTNEEGKSGIKIQDTKHIYEVAQKCLENDLIKWEGLMTIGPTPVSVQDFHERDYLKKTREAFHKTYKLKEALAQELGCSLPRLSMGMSHDYKIAVQEGATEIRIGSLLFGERKCRN